MLPDSGRWNHNVHHHRLILEAIPPTARTALDVGCGEGTLCRAMRGQVPDVVGIDVDPTSIALATAAGGGVRYVLGDFLSHDFAPESFDVVASVATLHHMDAERALLRMGEILRPGGLLAVIGVARRTAGDLPYDVAGFFAHRWLRLRHGLWEHPSPLTDPTMSHREIRRLAGAVLPEATYRRHVLFRYSLIWTKPGGPVPGP